MSSTVSLPVEPQVSAPASVRPRKEFRLFPRFETDPKIVSFAQTLPGKLLLLAIFGLTLSSLDDAWGLKLALVSSMTFLPKARRLLVTLGTILFTDFLWFERSNLTSITTAASVRLTHAKEIACIVLPFVLLSAGLMWLVARYPRSLTARRPLLTLLALCGMLAMVASHALLSGFWRFAIWAFLLTFCSYFWYLAYALSDCATGRGDNVLYQFGTFHPFWGSSMVPYPKGSSYWRKIEAKTPEELAVTMIKGVKLIVWCFLLSRAKIYYIAVVYDRFAIPNPGDCVHAFLHGTPLPFVMNWLCWPSDLLRQLLAISVMGHAIIATCRMAGFRALRNTYAPLSSRTIAEYWNRYYYYFKELLVDMFFYPTFIRYFKRYPNTRIFFATFVAASLGNTLYHFLLDFYIVLNLGLAKAMWSFRGYFFYSFMLALGISFSQIRSRKPRGSRGWFRERLVAPVCVLGFYCLVHVFEVSAPVDGLRYLAYMFTGR